MTSLRSRTTLPPKDRNVVSPADDDQSNPTSKPKAYVSDPDEGPSRLSLLDVLRVLGGLFLLSSTLSYFITGNSILWGYRPAFTRPARIKAWLVRSLPFKNSFQCPYTNRPPLPSTVLTISQTLNYPSTMALTSPYPSSSPSMEPSTTSLRPRISTARAAATRSLPAETRRGRS